MLLGGLALVACGRTVRYSQPEPGFLHYRADDVVGAFTAARQDAFLTSYNLRNLLLATMPLAFVSLGQTCALLVGGFDVSVGPLMTFCVVLASYTMTPTTSTLGLRRSCARSAAARARYRDCRGAGSSRAPHR